MRSPLFDRAELDLLLNIHEAETKLIDLDTLELLADIKDDLRYRIAYRQLRMELVDANTSIDDLVKEVDEFKRMCAALTWRVEP